MMEQLIKVNRRLSGAGSAGIADCSALAVEVWGDRSKEKDSGMLAFAYLWRRFGPPWRGGDEYKSLVDYTLTTTDPDVFLWLHLSGAGLDLSVGYLADKSIQEEARRPYSEWESKLFEWWFRQHPEFESLEESEENRRNVSEMYWNERADREDSFVEKAIGEIGDFPMEQDPLRWREDDGVVHRVNSALHDAMVELLRPVYVRDCPINLFGRCDDTQCSAQQSKYAGFGIPHEAMEQLVSSQNRVPAVRETGTE